MAIGVVKGTRLEFVAVPIEGTVKRKQYNLVPRKKDKDGKATSYERVEKVVEQAAGWMVYFPRGHVLRLTDRWMKAYNLNRQPGIINMEGLINSNSPLGQLFAAQDKDGRAEAMLSLQQKVIALATKRSGTQLLTKEAA